MTAKHQEYFLLRPNCVGRACEPTHGPCGHDLGLLFEPCGTIAKLKQCFVGPYQEGNTSSLD
jgi:hypothetical protein